MTSAFAPCRPRKGGVGVTDFFDGPEQLVVAHRGLALDYPENTIPAFRAGLDAGADILETDVHASQDGVAMISHDPSLERVASRKEFVHQHTAAALAAVDLGGAPMPTLAQALEEFPDTRFSVDVKHPAALWPTINLLRSMNATNRVMVASFTPRLRAEAIAALSPITNCATSDQIIPGYLASMASMPKLAQRFLSEVNAVFVPPSRWGLDLTHPRFIDAIRAAGATPGVWTINDPDQMTALWCRGVRAIITDRTDLAVAARAAL